ncbi:TPA: hypothetical protein ACWSJ0_002263 [Klebsiella pneumoniae]|uniref:hypothetical protein n=1 Tax=Klebsiella pneumoniae complex TaxID=3390273 RepID=UPI00108246D0|nr:MULTISPECIES: hypothetical protein [Klebsiella]HDS6350279.1 hypothetical protein [Klebsiella pneumoniae subsp. pneumoniae]MBX4705782.1 hypothetical protein [Klebsiella pneumoniae]MDD7844837.1 hypothetical protein [Klebsiella quasipneumoniae]MDD7858303.1 hypothetical protein [Klebsiella quasipneumoniae]MDF8305969.1 hypothetical protein [Klebsiella quasipneumoniae]
MDSKDEMQIVVARKLRDKDICHYVNMANLTDVGVYITLFTKCGVITGKIISGKKYYESIEKSYSTFQEGTNGAMIYQYFQEAKKNYTEEADWVEDEGASYPLNFMHLEDVSIMVGTGALREFSNGVLRIKIEEIDGYMLGQIQQKS